MSGHSLSEGQTRRRFRLIFVYLLLLSPWIVTGAMAALQTTANSPLDWVNSDFLPRREYDEFTEQFGDGDFVIISWPGCSIDDERLDRFTHSLRHSSGFHADGEWLFNRVTSGREMMKHFTSPTMGLSHEEAKRRVGTSLLGSDGETTAVVIGFNAEGLRGRARLIPLIRAAATMYAGAAHNIQHLAGPVIDGNEVDAASQSTMRRFAPVSSLIVFGLCLICLDSLYGAVLVFGIACLSQGISLAIVHYCGGTMTALMIVLPPLIQVLAIAGGIHLVNYYFDHSDGSAEDAITAAVRLGWLPCVLSSMTTAIGLGSLAVSGLVAVREFGIFAAIGVIVALAALLVFLPGFMRWKPIRPPSAKNRQPAAFWSVLLDLQQRYYGVISGVGIAAMIVLGIGVSRLQPSVRIETLFGRESQLMRDYTWIEKHVGPQVPIEVIVHFARPTELSASNRLTILDRVGSQLLSEQAIQSVTSCRDFMPHATIPLTGAFAQNYLDSVAESVRSVGYLRTTEQGERWRLTAHVSALGDYDYGVILNRLRQGLEADFGDIEGMSIELSGLMPLVHEIQRQLLDDLYASFVTAFGLIAIVMTIVQAGLIAGFVSMVPNVFPTLALFGMLGWLDYPIDIGSIMTASVAMGIAVDDTLHFLTFVQRRIDRGEEPASAILNAYQHCGRAMIQTTLICGCGLAIFAFSDFVPTARFAWMMVTLLVAALIGDLILLPSLILCFLTKTPRRGLGPTD
ncbi:MAG: MMPL family transporter [Pirellulaceae bacterium]